jgi:hypothetical protein
LKNIELAGTAVTNYCVATGTPAAIPATCGFTGPTNVNFLSLRENRSGFINKDQLLTTNIPTPQPFQLQFGARFQF